MKQTNFHLFDFLDFDTSLDGHEILWKACKPVNIDKLNNDIVITIPFQKQKCSNEIRPDTTEPPRNHYLRIRGYGEKILRISFDFKVPEMNDSPMLDISPVLKFCQFDVDTNNNQWVVKDRKGNNKAVFNLAEAETKFWSPLLPKPEETLLS